MPAAVYVHVPFCRAKCSYCDFVAFAHRETDIERWSQQVLAELEHWSHHRDGETARSVFFGGGTPSLVPASILGNLLEAIGRAIGIASGAEISLEANPSSTEPERAAGWRAAGFTRVSLGVQSFDAVRLRLLGRLHGPAGAREAVDVVRAAGFERVSLDLIYGLPGHGIADWEHELEQALHLETGHLSLYALTVEAGTPLARQVVAGDVQVPDDDVLADCYELAEARLDAAGYRHYEISNWARPGHECRHNLAYWRNETFLGLGAGAWSRAHDARFAVTSDLDAYLAWDGVPAATPLHPTLHNPIEPIDASGDARETAMLQLRLDDGLDLDAFASRHGTSARAAVESALSEPEAWGLVAAQGARRTLTPRGRLLSNDVFQRILVP
jgi:oxygen-independent coproporphyrinogen-3 oxidase